MKDVALITGFVLLGTGFYFALQLVTWLFLFHVNPAAARGVERWLPSAGGGATAAAMVLSAVASFFRAEPIFPAAAVYGMLVATVFGASYGALRLAMRLRGK